MICTIKNQKLPLRYVRNVGLLITTGEICGEMTEKGMVHVRESYLRLPCASSLLIAAVLRHRPCLWRAALTFCSL